MDRIITCTECPKGCQVTVTYTNKIIENVLGNSCPRGKLYAINEITEPRRVLTSTIKVKGGGVLPVKTKRPILKENVFKVMDKINKIEVNKPIEIGEVVFNNIDEDIDLIATNRLE